MNNEKWAKADAEVLAMLSTRLQEMLLRISEVDRRHPAQVVPWLIETYAMGRLRDVGDQTVSPRIRIIDLPERSVLVESVRVRTVPVAIDEITSRPPKAGEHE